MAPHVVLHDPGEQLECTVAGFVTEGVVEGLELVEVSEHGDELHICLEQLFELGFHHPTVGQPGEPVGCGLLTRTLQGAQRADTGADLAGDGGEAVDVLDVGRDPLGAHGSQHAHSQSSGTDRHAHCRTRAACALSQPRARVDGT